MNQHFRNTKDIQAQIQININNFFQLTFLNPDQILAIKSILNDIHYTKKNKIKQLKWLKQQVNIKSINYYQSQKIKIYETNQNSTFRTYRPTSPLRNQEISQDLNYLEEKLKYALTQNKIYQNLWNKTSSMKLSIEKEVNKLKSNYNIEHNRFYVLNEEEIKAGKQISMLQKIQKQNANQFQNLLTELKYDKAEKEARKQILVHQIEEVHHEEVEQLSKKEDIKLRLGKQNALIDQLDEERKPALKVDHFKNLEIQNTHNYIHKVNKMNCKNEEIFQCINCIVSEYNKISDENLVHERNISRLQQNIFDAKLQIEDQNELIDNQKIWYQKGKQQNSEIEIIQDFNLTSIPQDEQDEYFIEVYKTKQKMHKIQQFLDYVTYRINHLYQQVEKIRYPKSYLFCDQNETWPIKDIFVKINAQSAVLQQQVDNNTKPKFKTFSTGVISTSDTCITKYHRIVSAKIQQFQKYTGKTEDAHETCDQSFDEFQQGSIIKSPKEKEIELSRGGTFYQSKRKIKQYSPGAIRNEIQCRIRSYSRSPVRQHANLLSSEDDTVNQTAINLMNQFKIIPTKVKRSSNIKK